MDRLASSSSIRRSSRRAALVTSLSGLAAVGAAGFAIASAQQATPVASPVASDDASYLFVQAGFSSGSLADNGDGTFQLTLLNAPAYTESG